MVAAKVAEMQVVVGIVDTAYAVDDDAVEVHRCRT